jgi:glucose-1-phosphate adenylyltransferase
MDINQMIDFHLSRAALLTIAAIPVPVEEAREFGIIEIDADNRMIGFEEKPKEPKQMPNRPGWCLASMGNYLFTSKFLVRELLKGANDGATDFGKHIIPRLYKEYPVYVYDFNTNIVRGEKASTKGYWRDVGTLDAFFEANMDLCSENPPFDLYNNYWPIRTYNWNQPPARFFAGDNESHQGAAVDSIVSAGCIIGGGTVVKSILSPGVTIQKDALVEESILFPNVTIGPGAKVRRAIVEKGLHIPAGFQIGYDLERDKQLFHVTESGIVVLAKDTIIKA